MLQKCRVVGLGVAYAHAAVAGFQHRSLDERGLREHGGDCTGLIDDLFALIIAQRTPTGAAAIEHGFPAERFLPIYKLLFIKAISAEFVEAMGHTVLGQPAACLLHRVAILDAVQRGLKLRLTYFCSHAQQKNQSRACMRRNSLLSPSDRFAGPRPAKSAAISCSMRCVRLPGSGWVLRNSGCGEPLRDSASICITSLSARGS